MNQTIGVQISNSSAVISNSRHRGHSSRPMIPSNMPRISPIIASTARPKPAATGFATHLVGTTQYQRERRGADPGKFPSISAPSGTGYDKQAPRFQNFKTGALNHSATLPSPELLSLNAVDRARQREVGTSRIESLAGLLRPIDHQAIATRHNRRFDRTAQSRAARWAREPLKFVGASLMRPADFCRSLGTCRPCTRRDREVRDHAGARRSYFERRFTSRTAPRAALVVSAA
jgi:hypothetical protein